MMLWLLLFHIMSLLLILPSPIRGDDYNLTECNRNGNFDIVQNQQPVLTCTGLRKTQNISWSIINSSSGNEILIGKCGKCRVSCSGCLSQVKGYTISRDSNDRTTLQFLNHSLVTSGSTIKCSNLANKFNATCTLFVVPDLEEANITLHDNWTVTGSVTVSKVPASDNITCLWYNSVNNEMHHLASSAAGLTPHDNSDTGKACLNVSCHLNTTLSPYMVGSNDILVKILPGGRPFRAATVTVEEPGSLILDGSTCLLSVTEGSNLTCTCKNKDDTQGYPSGSVLWTNNAGSAVLELPNIQQNQSGVVHVCRSLWGPQDEVFETLNYSVIVNPLDLNQERATGLPVAAVAGSVVGFVVIVAIAIFIVVILKRRRYKREATEERRDTVPLEDEFEEHINGFYQSADDPDLLRPSPHNSLAPVSLANCSVDPQGPGSDGAQNHVYAQVNKGNKEKPEDNKEKPGKAHDVKQLTKGGQTQKHADTGDKGGPSPEEQGAVYTECVSDNKEDNSVTNVYMNVDESPPLRPDQDTRAAKKDSGNEDLHDPDLNPYHNTETTRHQGDYTNVQLELNDGEGVMTTAETDDEYRHLQLARPEQLDENPTYNHLAGV